MLLVLLIEILNHKIYWLILTHMNLKFVILDQQKDYKKEKSMSATFVLDITEHLNLYLEQLIIHHQLMFGQSAVLLLNYC